MTYSIAIGRFVLHLRLRQETRGHWVHSCADVDGTAPEPASLMLKLVWPNANVVLWEHCRNFRLQDYSSRTLNLLLREPHGTHSRLVRCAHKAGSGRGAQDTRAAAVSVAYHAGGSKRGGESRRTRRRRQHATVSDFLSAGCARNLSVLTSRQLKQTVRN